MFRSRGEVAIETSRTQKLREKGFLPPILESETHFFSDYELSQVKEMFLEAQTDVRFVLDEFVL